jgi:hypothetical protein
MLSRTLWLVAVWAMTMTGVRGAEAWKPLFNGKDLSGWETFLAKPDREWDVPGVKRDAEGNYLEAIGVNRDPLGVFTVTTVDGQPAIHVSGQGFGVMRTVLPYGNFRLRLQYKWGVKKWGSRKNAARDAGLLYFCHGPNGFDHGTWPRSVEMQIQEHDAGDLYALATQVMVPARRDGHLWLYDPQGVRTLFEQKKPIGNRCVRLVDAENPHGEWNTVELICLNGDSVHVVNGHVVMRLYDAQRLDGGSPAPLTEGTISLQTEGAELYYRNVELLPVTAMPPEFAGK